jgi:xylulokinase
MIAIGVDSGTRSTKVLLVDFETGRVLGRGKAEHVLVPDLPPRASEQHPSMWVAAFEEALGEALRAASIDPAEAAALGVSGQQHGFVPLAAGGRPIRPAKLWNDTATIEETAEIVEKLGGPAGVVDKLGLGLAVGYTASKILWLKKREPENFAALAHILLPHDYLNLFLTGDYRMEYGDASGTGLMDIRTRRWRSEALEAIDPRLAEFLPVPGPPETPAGILRPAVARKFGFGRVIVASGGGDNMMSAIGTRNVLPGAATLSLGTSGTISCYSGRPAVDAGGEIACFCDSTGAWLPLACTLNVANAEEAVRRLFRLDHAGVEAAAAKSAPGAEGIIYLPYLDGERVPVLPEASGAFFGLTSRNTRPENIARAVLEGVALNLRYGWRRLEALGIRAEEMMATGGGSNNPAWLRIIADVLRVPVSVPEEREAAAYGAAIQAIWIHGRDRGEDVPLSELAGRFVRKEGSAVEPDPATAQIYGDLGVRFDGMTRAMGPEFAPHKAFTDRFFG